MKNLFQLLMLGLLLGLLACNPTPTPTVPAPSVSPLGLLKVTITGVDEGANPTATAEWVQPATAEVNTQAATVVPVNGSNALGDVQIIRREVGFTDNDITSTRSVTATFDLINRTLLKFDNFTLYAVHKEGLSLGGTGIVALTSGTGASITDLSIARSFKPTHGMRRLVRGLEVDPITADLQFFRPSEIDNPTDGIKQQGIAGGLLSAADTVLEYGFVARNFSGGRVIEARNNGTDCTANACKGTLTLAYQFPKVNPRQNNPFSFSLFFIVANETEKIGSQSLEELNTNAAMGLTNLMGFDQIRTLGGTAFVRGGMNHLCRVKYAISPNLFLGPDPTPTPPGSLDTCFGTGGKVTTNTERPNRGNSNALAMAVGPNGQITVGTTVEIPIFTGPSTNFFLAQFNPNGSLDTGFDGDGKTIPTLPRELYELHALAYQPDGKVLAAGYGTIVSRDTVLARYNPDGSPDTSFSGDGVALEFSLVSIFQDEAFALAIQPDGKIVTAGYAIKSFTPPVTNLAVVRYNPDGSPDTSFDGDGFVTTNFSISPSPASVTASANSVAVQADGKIVVAGNSIIDGKNHIVLVRYNQSGSLDTSFDGDGKLAMAIGPGNSGASSIGIQKDGKIVVAGFTDMVATPNVNADFVVVRYNQNGSLDTSFGAGGIVTTAIGSGIEVANSLTIGADGKIVVLGTTFSGSNADFGLVRYNPDGSLDTSFDGDGKLTLAFGPGNDFGTTVATDLNGKIVVAGRTANGNQNDIAVARINP